MWKPGTSKPSSNNAPPQNLSLSSSSKSPKGVGGSSGKSKLSTSTMGMKFMQRKNQSKNTKDKEALQHAADRNSSKNHHTTNNDTMDSKKRENEQISKKDQQQSATSSSSSSDAVIILELASVSDMHGTGADIIGRRSFGGFHKSVSNTWDAALKQRTDDEARTQYAESYYR